VAQRYKGRMLQHSNVLMMPHLISSLYDDAAKKLVSFYNMLAMLCPASLMQRRRMSTLSISLPRNFAKTYVKKL
jgi:hypothetical protein